MLDNTAQTVFLAVHNPPGGESDIGFIIRVRNSDAFQIFKLEEYTSLEYIRSAEGVRFWIICTPGVRVYGANLRPDGRSYRNGHKFACFPSREEARTWIQQQEARRLIKWM